MLPIVAAPKYRGEAEAVGPDDRERVVAQRLSIHREGGHCGRDQVGSKEKRKGSNP
jgi:hypothetical protein